MKRRIVLFILIAVLVVFGAACRQQPPPEQTPPPGQTPPPEQPQDPQGKYEDGTHEAELEPDERGWKAVVEVTVEGGKITAAAFDEVNEEGAKKSEDEEYLERWGTAANIDASEVYPKYEEDLIETQDVEEVEVITGATSTHEKFQDVVKKALGK